jgi:hypothetical protein
MSESRDSNIGSWVPCGSEPRMTVLAMTSSNLRDRPTATPHPRTSVGVCTLVNGRSPQGWSLRRVGDHLRNVLQNISNWKKSKYKEYKSAAYAKFISYTLATESHSTLIPTYPSQRCFCLQARRVSQARNHQAASNALLQVGFTLRLLFKPEYCGDIFLRSIHWISTNHTALYPKRLNSSIKYSLCN